MKEIIDKYFFLDVADYLPIGMSLYLNEILFFLFLGIGLAALIAGWQRGVLYRGMRVFLRKKAVGEENAKTPAELGITEKKDLMRALGEGGILRKTVAVRGEVRPTYEEYLAAEREKKQNKNKKEKELKEDLSGKAFYLPEAEVDRASRIYERGAPSKLATALFLPAILALYVGIAMLMPSVLSLFASL